MATLGETACAGDARRPSGTLFGWGMAAGGGLPGITGDKAEDCPYPQPVRLGCSSATRFQKVCCDGGTFAALEEGGGLWAWRMNEKDGDSKPRILLTGVVDCDVGSSFVAGITVEGSLIVFGKVPGPLQRGVSKPTGSRSDTRPELFLGGAPEGTRLNVPAAMEVAACGDTLLVLCTDGQVYGCGHELTNGLGRAVCAMEPLSFGDALISKVALGSRHGAAVSTDGRLFVWGDGRSGALGLGRRMHNLALTLLPIECPGPFLGVDGAPVRVVAVSCTRGQPNPKCFASKRDGKAVWAGGQGAETSPWMFCLQK